MCSLVRIGTVGFLSVEVVGIYDTNQRKQSFWKSIKSGVTCFRYTKTSYTNLYFMDSFLRNSALRTKVCFHKFFKDYFRFPFVFLNKFPKRNNFNWENDSLLSSKIRCCYSKKLNSKYVCEYIDAITSAQVIFKPYKNSRTHCNTAIKEIPRVIYFHLWRLSIPSVIFIFFFYKIILQLPSNILLYIPELLTYEKYSSEPTCSMLRVHL